MRISLGLTLSSIFSRRQTEKNNPFNEIPLEKKRVNIGCIEKYIFVMQYCLDS